MSFVVSWHAHYFFSPFILAYLCCDQRNKISLNNKKKNHFKEDKSAHQEPEATLEVQEDDQMTGLIFYLRNSLRFLVRGPALNRIRQLECPTTLELNQQLIQAEACPPRCWRELTVKMTQR